MMRYHRFVNIILLVLVGIILSAGTSLSDVNCELITNQNTYWPAPDMNQPEYLETVTDPSFGTKITRIVGDPGTPLPNVPGQVWASEQLRHGYSKRQVWNSDQSMIFLDRHVPNLWLDGNTSPSTLKTLPVLCGSRSSSICSIRSKSF